MLGSSRGIKVTGAQTLAEYANDEICINERKQRLFLPRPVADDKMNSRLCPIGVQHRFAALTSGLSSA